MRREARFRSRPRERTLAASVAILGMPSCTFQRLASWWLRRLNYRQNQSLSPRGRMSDIRRDVFRYLLDTGRSLGITP